MNFLSKWFRASKTDDQMAYSAKSAPRHMMQAVTPTAAKHTPKKYENLSREGYGHNVIAHRAINMVARGVASIPLQLYQKGERLLSHPLLDLLRRPNPLQKNTALLYTMTGYYLIAGNSYLLSVGPEQAPPCELWLLRPDSVGLKFDQQNMLTHYEQRIGAKNRQFDKASVLHWKTFNPLNEWQGMAPLEAAATAVDIHNEGSRWNLALIQNGGCPSGILYQENAAEPLTEAQFNRLKQEVNDHYTGAVNAGRPLLLEGGLRWQDMSVSPSDMDWLEAKNMASREIAMAFGVPAQLVGIPDSQTYANMAEARLSLWEETILPLSAELLDHLNGWLVPKFGADLTLKWDLEAVPALDQKRSRRLERLNSLNFMTINEKRAAIGLPPLPDGQGGFSVGKGEI